MRISILLAFICAISGAHGQATDPAAYQRFKAASAKNSPDELHSLAREWSTAVLAHERHLALLATAAAEFRSDDFPACIRALDRADSLVPRNDTLARAMAMQLRSRTMNQLGDPSGAERIAMEGLAHVPGPPFDEVSLGLRTARVEALLYQGQYDHAQEQIIAVGRDAERLGAASIRGSVQNILGNIRLVQERYEEAWSHFTEALSISRNAGLEMAVQNNLVNLGIVATMTERHDLAIHLYDSLITELEDRSPQLRADLYHAKAVSLRRKERHQDAVAAINLALHLMDSIGDEQRMAELEQDLGMGLWDMGRREEGLAVMLRALRSSERSRKPAIMQEELHYDLYSRYHTMGRTAEALAHLEAYTEIADSLQKVRFNDQLARSEVLFETAAKERRIAEQQQALELATAEQRRRSVQRNAAIGLAGVLVLALLLLGRLSRVRRIRMEQERALREQQVDSLLQQQEITAMHAMIEGQEKERSRLASELHGRIGGMLGGVKLQMETLEERMGTGQRERDEQYKKVYDLLVETVGEVRRISHDMGSVVLARFGLAKALENLCDSVRVHGKLTVELSLHSLDHRMERSVEITVYRIVQELVGNVLKHANATELSVAVTRAPGRLSVMVTDNGSGFDTTATPQGIGLDNVRSHASAIGAAIRVDSAIGQGTTVSVEGPVVE